MNPGDIYIVNSLAKTGRVYAWNEKNQTTTLFVGDIVTYIETLPGDHGSYNVIMKDGALLRLHKEYFDCGVMIPIVQKET
jgi:hypothetical protein